MQMWPDLIQKSKDGGLDVIETYIFWDLHEPVRNQVYDKFNNNKKKILKYLFFSRFTSFLGYSSIFAFLLYLLRKFYKTRKQKEFPFIGLCIKIQES